MMAPQKQHLWLNGSNMLQKLQLTFKLMQLENARITFEKELRDLTVKAAEDVRDFTTSSPSPEMFNEIEKALDVKQEIILMLSYLLHKVTVGRDTGLQLQVKDPLKLNPLSLFRELIVPDAVKVWPMFKHGPVAKSILKPALHYGMSSSFQQDKNIFYIQPQNIQSDSATTSQSICPLKSEEKESEVTEDSSLPDVVQVSLVSQTSEVGADLVPDVPPTVNPELSETEPLEVHQLCSWRSHNPVQVRHQIQTSRQLLQFFRYDAKSSGHKEVTVVENSDMFWLMDESHEPKSRDLNDACGPTPGAATTETQVPVFRIKDVDSTGCLTYSCVIATDTELWDVMEIGTDIRKKEESIDDESSRSRDGDEENESKNKRQDWVLSSSKPAGINSFTVPEFQIKNFEEAEVVVSHVVTPGNFYIQNVELARKHQSLIAAPCGTSSSYAEQNRIPDIGTKVMCWFPKQEQWCRAQVTKICGVSQDHKMNGSLDESSIIVEVKRLDYGDTSCLPLWNIQELTSDMAKLPLQALQVSLANVTPVNPTGWSEEAVAWFKDLTQGRIFYARFYPEDLGVAVELFLEKGKLGAMRRGASMSLRLAQNGHATHRELPVTRVKKSKYLEKEKQDSEWEKYLISCYAQRNV